MPHAREQIRDAVVSAITGLDTTGANVYALRVNPFRTLPALNVLTLDEEMRDDMGAMGDEQIRELRLRIEGRERDPSIPDDELDTIADEVEEAILNDATLDSLAFDLTLESTSFEYSRDGSNPTGKVEMIFAFLYQVDGRDPSIIIS